ncbi:hypothetical protein CMQ_6324 [Grosmannia clavigera kw1407]|uniref:Uncharacterized protein n=1 Tax=Grosmannia clavigera (strain kw1407 / UAMH 11150) TaxID=655863 RepID=F0XM05_GROCL|nr:uncharacterized protein CMQ_6324 [Grosmannia clavigera kw1407]EFX01382.1 hypothetical protein CMQ_6324 [Grosmannia clavigera kw1407]
MDEYEYDYLETGQEHLGDSTSIAGVKTEQDNLPAVDAVHNYNKPRTSIPNEVDDVSNRLGRVSLSSNDSIDDFNYDYTSSMPSSITTGTQATALSLTSARYTHRPYKGSHIQREPPVQTPELRDTSSSGNQSQYTAYTPSTNYTQMHQYGYPGLGNNYTQQPQYVHQELGADYVREPQYGYQDTGSGYIQQSPYTFAATGAFFSQNVYSVQTKGMENDTPHISNHERSGSYTNSGDVYPQPGLSAYTSSYYEHSKQQSITVGVVNPYDENQQRPFASGPVPSSSTWDPGYVADFDSNEKLQGLKYPIEDGDDELLGDLADQQMTSGNNMPGKI